MPLQLISIFSFIFMFLAQAFSSPQVAKLGCQEQCGNLSIPYPFGVGKGCSLEPSFDIDCRTSSYYPPTPYLSIINAEVIEINETYVRVKYPNLISACYDSSNYKTKSMSVNLSGTVYTLSSFNQLTTIGCDDMVVQYTNGTWASGGCSAFCVETNDTGSFGYCPFNGTSLGNGCCLTDITSGTYFIGARLIDMSGKLLRERLFPCSHAFIRESSDVNETAFSYPLYYLDNSTALVNDNWASTTTLPVVRLDWKIKGAENCSQAKHNGNTYACQDNKSVCSDDSVNGIYFEDSISGYQCSCVPGYEGNPYLTGGCKAISFSSSIAKYGCLDQCGNLSIPFPFGIGPKCSLAPYFDVSCDTSANPPIAHLNILNKTITYLDSSQVQVVYPNLGFSCYNLSDDQRTITKTKVLNLIIDLFGTQYTLSDKNWITAIGFDDMVVGRIQQSNKSSIGSSCTASVYEGREISSISYGDCPSGETTYWPGDGCCRAPIPKGTTYLEASLSDVNGRWPRTNFSCSYAFVINQEDGYNYSSYPILNNSTGISLYYPYEEISWWQKILTLDWRIGSTNCNKAKGNLATFACKANSDCIDFDASVGGYLCNCTKGYQGNPYLTQGCHDIDECADITTNLCNSMSNCFNTIGTFYCSCPKGYTGDGKKDGSGCIKLLKSKTKMIILTGMCSGIGFVLLLVLFWLHNVLLRKRKNKKLKESFFKRNGGLLLQQQTNEGTLGKPIHFLAKELQVATDNFHESRILGQGGQGTVYKGMLSDGKIVAIKKSKFVEANQLEQFINELVILSQINHRNVVKLLGCCLESEVPLLVYEFMPNGTLFDLIHVTNNEFPFPWNMRLKAATDIAGALAYLHSSSSVPIYHRDVKSSNILLDEKYVVKVSDFGTSRSVAADQTHLTTLVKGTFGYLDPEYFESSQFTEKSDVYSFGVVLVELLTGQRPISMIKIEDDRGLAARFLTSMDENSLETILDPQVSEQDNRRGVFLMAKLAQRCLNLKGKMRPTMKEVAMELESSRISEMATDAKDEFEEVRGFEDMSSVTSDSSDHMVNDIHSLMFREE